MADLSEYTALITSEHNQRPKFMAVVSALAQPMVDLMNVLGSMPTKFDLDQAVGVQLDDVGRWVGISRIIRTPLTNVYFSLDIDGIGFDQGIWKGPFDPDTGLTTLYDDTYRAVIRAKIGANHWDGTMEGSVAILNSIFSPAGELEPKQVHANAERFGVGDGSRFQYQLLYQGQPVYKVDSATLFRRDWQGNQKLYPMPRTNLLRGSDNLEGWTRGSAATWIDGAGAPDGTNSAVRVTGLQGVSIVSTGTSGYMAGVPVATGVTYTAYVYASLDGGSAGSQFRIRAKTNPSGQNFVATETLEVGAFKRVELQFTVPPGDSTVDIVFGTPLDPLNTTIFGAQLSEGATAASYIPTESTAVTLTDYTLSPTGIVELDQTPVSGATLTWTGDGYTYPSGTYVFIQDNQDMTMTIGIAGKMPSAVFLALLEGGYIPLKPEGVRVNFTVVTTVEGSPLFGFDVNNPYAAGFDVGAWGRLL